MGIVLSFILGAVAGAVITHVGYSTVIAEIKNDLYAAESRIREMIHNR